MPGPDTQPMALTDPSFCLTITSTSRDVRQALQDIRILLETLGESPDVTGRVEIALAEVLNNIVEHALALHESGQIDIEARHLEDGWFFRIEDGGVPMPGGMAGAAFPVTDRPLQDLPEGGFGWAIVRTLACDLQYARRNGRNCLSFRLPNC